MSLFDSDFISVKSKRAAAEHIVKCYGDFGWQLTEKKDDKMYGDVLHMTFTRPHFIENKDELQLLQVRLEIAYNNTGKYTYKSSLRAALSGGFFGLLTAAFVAGGVFLILTAAVLHIIFGSLLCAVGVAAGVIGGTVSYSIHKKDKEKYAALIVKEVEKIEGLCKRARELRGIYE